MNVVFFITSVFFLLSVVRTVFFWVWLWQIKEYRLDRMYVHLTETLQGRSLFLSPFLWLKIITIGVYFFFILNISLITGYELFISVLIIAQGIMVLREISLHVLRRPIFTIKSICMLLVIGILIWMVYMIPPLDRFVWLLFIERLVIFLTAFFVLALYFPTEFYRDIQIENSIKKISKNKNVLIIGVTGSYGKSSTKEFVAQVLAKKFRVLKTLGTNNTPIGIASTILRGLKDTTEIFVVEMGAYKRGEIAQLSQMVHPKIGILTAVNDQHLSLFGSIENTMRAKYELIESLPKDGLALFNGESDNAVSLYKKTKIEKVLYSTHVLPGELGRGSSRIFAENIDSHKTHIEFDVVQGATSSRYKTLLIGEHNVENILPAIYIARHLKMSERDIKQAVLNLKPIEKTMIVSQLSHGPTVVDDTFNANPESVLSALKYMKMYKGKKVIVLQPMIELGKNSKKEHYRIAKEIAKVCDNLFLTNRNFLRSVEKGVSDTPYECLVQVARPNEIEEFITKDLKAGDVVVFEGKESFRSLSRVV